MPLFPFFLVNLLMGLTRLRVRHYWWVSQLAMLPATVIYLNAGRELGKLTSLRDILSPGLLFAFTLLGLLPLVTRWLFSRYIPSIKKVRHYAPGAFLRVSDESAAGNLCLRRRELAIHSATGHRADRLV